MGGLKFSSLAYGNCRDLPHAPILIQTHIIIILSSHKNILTLNFRIKTINGLSLIILPNMANGISLICLLYFCVSDLRLRSGYDVTATCYHLSSGRLTKVENERKFQTFCPKSGRGRSREVVAYERFQL